MFRSLQWEDWAGVALGAWLLASPWVLGYSDVTAAVMNALVVGTILVLEEFMEIGVHEETEEWLDLVPGAWLVISPVMLGFQASTAASANAMAVGVLTIAFAICAITSVDKVIARWWHDHHAMHA
ncbi:MAG: SPW repeat protein [Betaproteobacteria bacterium]